MGLGKKLVSLNKIALSKAKETVKCLYLEGKVKKLDKNIDDAKNKDKRKMQYNKREALQNINAIKFNEGIQRREEAKKLKEEAKISINERRNDNKDLSAISKLQKQFKDLPIVTVVDDLVEGASEIEKITRMVNENPRDPYSWLILAETLKYYKKAFLILNTIKIPVDPIGSLIDIGVEIGGGYIEENLDKDKWSYKRALLKCINLGLKSDIKDEKTLICIGRSAQLLAKEAKEPLERDNLTILSNRHFKEALKVVSNGSKDELMYYLGVIEQKKVKRFKYAYRKNILKAATFGAVNMVTKQSGKFIRTGEKILDKTLDVLIKE
ncbi:hypothetical protein [Clostridium peptidivorans]|uniref:hypothetical protein n=1 Tax=Clostridium peptidivorans TaxID=100174 RepID=UPI000BE32716|nr:hypothetical protein [Clostridium peptidivorans]